MKNENKTKAAPDAAGSQGAPGRVSGGEHGHPRAVGWRGWGDTGVTGGGGCPPRCPCSPCCELCRRRPWHPGPGGPRCSRGSLGCSASPAALRQGGKHTGHPRAAGLGQPGHPAPASIRPGEAREESRRRTGSSAGSRQPPTSPGPSGQHHAKGCAWTELTIAQPKPTLPPGPVGAGSATLTDEKENPKITSKQTVR